MTIFRHCVENIAAAEPTYRLCRKPTGTIATGMTEEEKHKRDLSDRKFYPADEEAEFQKKQPQQTPQTAHPAYKLAFQDTDFLLRDELRPVRFQLELLKPEMLLDEAGVGSTLVMYGSARIPPNNPLSGRRTSQTWPSRSIHQPWPSRCGFTFFGALTGKAAGSAVAKAAQSCRSGQMPQAGLRGVQMVAPRSIMACAKSPARASGVTRSAAARIAERAAGANTAMEVLTLAAEARLPLADHIARGAREVTLATLAGGTDVEVCVFDRNANLVGRADG